MPGTTKSANEIRIEMSAAGWCSDDRITWMGWGAKEAEKYGYSIWFSRWKWHTEVWTKATYGAHTNDLSKIDETVAKAAAIAMKAWNEFPEYPPNMLADGTLRVDQYMYEFWKKLRDEPISDCEKEARKGRHERNYEEEKRREALMQSDLPLSEEAKMLRAEVLMLRDQLAMLADQQGVT